MANGGLCCVSTSSADSAGGATYCAAAIGGTTATTYINIPTSGNINYEGYVAMCPMYKNICTATVKNAALAAQAT